MASTVVANNKLRLAVERGQSIPLGWALDSEGRPTADPMVAREEGMAAPLGTTRELGSHKGYGLGVAVSILGGILSGAGFSTILPPRKFGHTFGAINIAAFRPVSEFKAMMDDMIRRLRNSKKAPGHDRIYVAGEIEYETAQQRRTHGIPLSPTTAETLTDLSQELGVPLALS
jgi:LDH2 family malate/lactate/ureidoglycolate dehydrogenase